MKKSLQQKSELREKGMAILVEKAECFESNNYRNVSTKELDVLLNWYGVEKKATKKAEKVEQWRMIRVANTEPPMDNVWTAEDEEKSIRLSNKEINNISDGMQRCRRELQLCLFWILPTRNGSL